MFFNKKSNSGHEISGITVDKFLKKAKFEHESSANELKIARLRLKNKIDEIDKLLSLFEGILSKEEEEKFLPQIDTARGLVQYDNISSERLEELADFVEMLIGRIKNKI